MTAFLMVPMHLDALHLAKDQPVLEPMADFSQLPYTDPQADGGPRDVNAGTAYLSENIVAEPFSDRSNALEQGIHLHWALPDALTHGSHPRAQAKAVIKGPVTRITVTDGGSGYQSAPDVTLAEGGGSGATAKVEIRGTVVKIDVTNGGSGYTNAPKVRLKGGGGTGARAEAEISGVTTITVTDGGSGYTQAPTVTLKGGGGSGAKATAKINGGNVTDIQLINGGSGYTNAPTVTLKGGGGSDAKATAEIGVGKVTAIRVTNGGADYTQPPTIALQGGGGSGATATAEIRGAVTAIAVTNGGSNYTTPPKVQLTDSGGSGARALAEIRGKVTTISVLDGGSGYTQAPTVTLKGGGGSGAKATAEIGVGKVRAIKVTDAGQGYAQAPEVIVALPPLVFPAVPNRWLVVRSQRGTIQKKWIVESDYLWPEETSWQPGRVAYPVEAAHQGPHKQPYRYLGRTTELSDWTEDATARHLDRLTALGYGEPTFHAFYPNCQGVFGLHDPDFADTAPPDGLQYDVFGWYSKTDDDLLTQFTKRYPDDADGRKACVKAAEGKFNWTWDPTKKLPDQMLCYGRLTFSQSATDASSYDPAHPDKFGQQITLAVGNTGTEALAAYLAHQIAGSGTDKKKQLENQLEALNLTDALGSERLDLGARFEEARHTRTYQAVAGGTLWTFRPCKPAHATRADAKKAADNVVFSLPDDLAAALDELNRLQAAYDRGQAQLVDLRRQIFADWYKYMICCYRPSDARRDYPPTDEAKWHLERMAALLHLLEHYAGTLGQPHAFSLLDLRDPYRKRPANVATIFDADFQAWLDGIPKFKSTSSVATRLTTKFGQIHDVLDKRHALKAAAADALPKITHLVLTPPGKAATTLQQIAEDLADQVNAVPNEPAFEVLAVQLSALLTEVATDAQLAALSKDLSGLLHGLATVAKSDLAAVQTALTSVAQRLAGLTDVTLAPTAAPRYWQPNEPVVLLAGPGVEPTDRHGADGLLPCDLTTADVTGADATAIGTIRSQVTTISGQWATYSAWSKPLDDTSVNLSEADQKALVKAYIQDRNKTVTDPKDKLKQPNNPLDYFNANKNALLEWAQSVRDGLGVGFRTTSGKPWHALLLEWDVSIAPVHGPLPIPGEAASTDPANVGNILPSTRQYGHDFVTWNYTLEETRAEFIRSKLYAVAVPSTSTLVGRSIITPHARELLEQRIEDYLRYQVEQYTAALRQHQPAAIIAWFDYHDPTSLVNAYVRSKPLSQPADARQFYKNKTNHSNILAWLGTDKSKSWVTSNVPTIAQTLTQQPLDRFKHPAGNDAAPVLAWCDQHHQAGLVDGFFAAPVIAEPQLSKAEKTRRAVVAQQAPPSDTPQKAQFFTDHKTNILNWYKERTPGGKQAKAPIHTVVEAWDTLQTLAKQKKHIQSQALGGFNTALLMHKQTLQLPVADPLNFPEYWAFTEQTVRPAVGRQNRVAPMPHFDFHPLRTGRMQLNRLRLVDTFGRTVKLQPDSLVTTESMTVGMEAKAALPARITQPARLSFRWLSAHDGRMETNAHPLTTPVCGWILPNNLDRSLMIYDNQGAPLGYLDETGRWRTPPGRSGPVLPEDIPNPYLGRMVAWLRDRARAVAASNFASDFLDVLESALENIAPRSFAQHEALALLIGRPIALVRASVNLEVHGLPATHQAWEAYQAVLDGQPPKTDDFRNVHFPIRIGEHMQLQDGVVGYWVEQDGGYQGDIFYAPQSHHTPRLGQDKNLVVYPDPKHDLNFYQSVNAPPTTVSILLDPRGSLHCTSGVLPTKVLTVPTEHYAQALKTINVTFLSTPVLTQRGQVHLPLPKEPGWGWSWVQKDGTRWTEITTTPVVARQAVLAAFPRYGTAIWNSLIQKKWLQPLDPAQTRATVKIKDRATFTKTFKDTLTQAGVNTEKQFDAGDVLRVLDLAARYLGPVHTDARFGPPQEIREGWLKLSREDDAPA